MGRRGTRSAVRPAAVAVRPPERIATDEDWPAALRDAVVSGVLLLAALVAVDAVAGSLDALRGGLWAALAVALFGLLLPPRVTAGQGWLAARGPLRRRLVCTERLVSVRWSEGVAQRLVLRDDAGRRLVVDPRVLLANPALWHLFATGARRAQESGVLLCGATALAQLAERAERETARTLLTESGPA
ncbi:hypothetical protein [Streptomyces catenulae]|uniref:PH domain-containing protein n=1 Tax=Streptomyces catenulae TaxID=66875 RepID=A0ABV2Z1G3_9ACTN|nr:hypothetical protein [Streptomyces catenulae]